MTAPHRIHAVHMSRTKSLHAMLRLLSTRLIVCLCLVLSACDVQTNAPGTTGEQPTAAPTEAAPGPLLTPTRAPAPSTPGPLNLVVWMSDEFALAPGPNGGDVLTATVASFQAAFPDIHVSLLPKKAYGKGGLVDLLSSTEDALPQAVPDVVTLDLRDVPQLARENRLQPFDPRFAPATLGDLFPFARGAGLVEGNLYALPFTSDALQIAFDSADLRSPPLTWSGLQTTTVRYAFAAGADNGQVSDSFLAQYVALGGKFSDATGKPSLDRTPLRAALEFYRSALSQGAIVTNVLSLKTPDDAWRQLTSGKANLVDTSTRTFLRERGSARNAGYGTIPTRDGNLATITRSWGYAIATKEPARQLAAERFVEWMLTAPNNASWNRASDRLPVRRSAVPLWSSDNGYRDFILALLSAAVNRPPTTGSNGVDAPLQTALSDVLANNASPADAADKAIASLGR
jgi:ABC-type glycerol-3-phosphate transport system substrate-binding protein